MVKNLIDLAVILRVTFFVLIILFQIIAIPALIGGYNELWKTGQKKVYILIVCSCLLMIPIAMRIDLFFLDILTGNLPISAIWEIT